MIVHSMPLYQLPDNSHYHSSSNVLLEHKYIKNVNINIDFWLLFY